MAVPVPFGAYAPGDSPLHRLEPRIKLGIAALFVVLIFTVEGVAGLALCAAVVALGISLSAVPARLVLRGLRPVVLLLAFTLFANALTFGEVTDALFTVGPLSVSASGLARGAFFVGRIVLLVAGTSLVTLTTSPVELTDAISRLLGPLERVRFPATDVAMMFSIALRFIPTTAEEAERIIVAQTARGARFKEGGLVARAKAYVPVLVPLFVALFRRADDLAVAMEARCYRGAGRTRLREMRVRAADWSALGAAIVVTVAGAVLL
jgi:energy-coupling factor transport system permease protein